MDPREEWIRELERRQDNIDPIRRIPNSALFQGRLINGDLRLNTVQRVGAAFMGICSLVTGAGLLIGGLLTLREGEWPGLVLFVFSPLSLWFGWKMTRNAIVNDPARAKRS